MVLSLNDHPKIREIFKDFEFREVDLPYSVNNKERTNGKKLLIGNYKLEFLLFDPQGRGAI